MLKRVLSPIVPCFRITRNPPNAEKISFVKRNQHRLGGILLLTATTAFAASTVDDILVFQKCSSQALEKAVNDKRVQELLGSSIRKGGWQQATIGFGHQGCSVSCSFPIYGTKRSAEIRLRGLRNQGSSIWTSMLKTGDWELVSVEVYTYQLGPGKGSLHCIELIQPE